MTLMISKQNKWGCRKTHIVASRLFLWLPVLPGIGGGGPLGTSVDSGLGFKCVDSSALGTNSVLIYPMGQRELGNKIKMRKGRNLCPH